MSVMEFWFSSVQRVCILDALHSSLQHGLAGKVNPEFMHYTDRFFDRVSFKAVSNMQRLTTVSEYFTHFVGRNFFRHSRRYLTENFLYPRMNNNNGLQTQADGV